MNNKRLLTISIFIVTIFIFSFIYKQRRHLINIDTNKEISQEQERNFVALGASITKANNLSPKLTGDNAEYSFSTGTKIDSVYLYLKKRGELLIPRNLAQSGADSRKVLSQQVPNAISLNPKYITIDIMSDIFEEEEPVKFKQNLTEIVKQVKTRDTVVLISTYPNIVSMRKAPYPSCSEDKLNFGVDNINEKKIKLFNEVIKEIADTQGLILVDIYSVLGTQDVSDYDCIHPNIEGQKKLAKAWISALEEKVVNKD